MQAEEARSRDHNLVNQIKVNGFNWRNYFPFFLEALVIISALAFGYYYREYLSGANSLPLVFICLGFFLMFSGLLTFLFHDIWKRIGIAALESLAATAAFFVSRPFSTLLFVWAILFIFMSWGIARAREDIATNLKIKFFHGFRLHLHKLVTGLTFMVLILYLPQWSASGTFFSENSFQKTFVPVTELITKFYPEINVSPTSTVQAVAESVALSQLARNPIFNDLPDAARKAAVQESVNSVLGSLEQGFGGEVNKSDSLPTAFYKAITSRLTRYKDKFPNGFIVVWAIIMFFLIRSLGAVTSWVSLLLAYGLYELLIVLKIIRIGEEQRTVEVLEFV
jgi:hypothetical protein